MKEPKWDSDGKLAARDYPDTDSRDAFRAGYSDGWYGAQRDAGDWPVGAYSAGYWEGYGDKHPEEQKP